MDHIRPNSLIQAYGILDHNALITSYASFHDTCVFVVFTPPTAHPNSAIRGRKAVQPSSEKTIDLHSSCQLCWCCIAHCSCIWWRWPSSSTTETRLLAVSRLRTLSSLVFIAQCHWHHEQSRWPVWRPHSGVARMGWGGVQRSC